MRSHDNSYSRLVAWLKIALPLLALAILSTLFLVAERRGTRNEIPYSEADIEEILRDQRIRNPNYAGVTTDGSAVAFSARSARPDAEASGGVEADRLIGVIETPDGARMELSSVSGRIDGHGDSARMAGGVSIKSSAGYRITTSGIDAALDVTHVTTDGEIVADGPLGDLTAGRMELTMENGRYLLSFTDGVKLIYRPARE